MYIRTKWLAPTNTKGARIVARTLSGRRRTTAWDCSKGQAENHTEAAKEAAVTFGLGQGLEWRGVISEDDAGYIFVCTAAPHGFTA